MLGYDPAEFEETNARWAERLHPEDREKVWATYQAYTRGELSSYEVEFRQRMKSGDWKWILSMGSIVAWSADGKPLRMLGTHFDITERKHIEEELRRSEQLFKEIGANIPELLWVRDAKTGEVLYLNDAWVSLTGQMVTRGIHFHSLFACVHPEDLDLVRASAAQHPLGGFSEVVRFKRLDGSTRWIRMSSFPIWSERGDVHRVAGVGEDITETREAQIRLQESEARLQQAQAMAKIGNWELNLSTNQLVWSDEIFRIFEINSGQFDASYEAFLSIVHPDDRDMVNKAYKVSVADHKPYAIIHRLLMADGRIKYVQEHGETDYDRSGRPIRSRGTVQDVTFRRLAELQTEMSLREKETLLREVHHRVKNNLQIISSLLYFQSKKIRDPADLSAFREGQDRLKSMILVHERLYRSDDLMRIDFADYAKALIDHIRQSYRPSSLRIKVVLDISPVVVPVEIALPVGMIVNELLTNVYKYAFPDGCEGIVRISVTRLEGGMELVVGDSGVGLPEGFERDRPSTFGMQLIYGLVSQLGGLVSFERQGGATIRISVPISNGKTTSY